MRLLTSLLLSLFLIVLPSIETDAAKSKSHKKSKKTYAKKSKATAKKYKKTKYKKKYGKSKKHKKKYKKAKKKPAPKNYRLTTFDYKLIRSLGNINESEKRTVKIKLDYINRTYSDLPSNIHKTGITIFLEPAHGLYRNGQSQSVRTNRISTRGLTEEYYSLKIARRLYRKLKKNPNIKVITTPSMEAALNGRRETYQNNSFWDSIKRAKKAGAHMIVSEHLNNAVLARRHNRELKKGIFFTHDDRGNPMVVHNTHVENGFLTLYNPYDASGMSYTVAKETKKGLAGTAFKVNSWEKGLVPDRRFVFFNEFPASIIFESGFICTRRDERLLYSAKGQEQLARAHYQGIVKAFEELLGTSLKKKKTKAVKKTSSFKSKLRALKKSRIGVYMLRKGKLSLARSLFDGARKETVSYAMRKNIQDFNTRLDKIRRNFNSFYNRSVSYNKNSKSSLLAQIGSLKKAIALCREYTTAGVKGHYRRRLTAVRKKLARLYPKAKQPPLSEDEKMERKFRNLIKKTDRTAYLVIQYPGQSRYAALAKTFGSSLSATELAAISKDIDKTYQKKWRTGIYLIYLDHKKTGPKVRRVKKRRMVRLSQNSLFSYQLYKNIRLKDKTAAFNISLAQYKQNSAKARLCKSEAVYTNQC